METDDRLYVCTGQRSAAWSQGAGVWRSAIPSAVNCCSFRLDGGWRHRKDTERPTDRQTRHRATQTRGQHTDRPSYSPRALTAHIRWSRRTRKQCRWHNRQVSKALQSCCLQTHSLQTQVCAEKRKESESAVHTTSGCSRACAVSTSAAIEREAARPCQGGAASARA